MTVAQALRRGPPGGSGHDRYAPRSPSGFSALRRTVVSCLLLCLGLLATATASGALAGGRWTFLASPDPYGNATLYGVSCRSAVACMAVGSSYDPSTHVQVPMSARWDGLKWRAVSVALLPHTSYGELKAVACPSPTTCVGVGDDQLSSGRWVTMAERSTSSRWQALATPALKPFRFNALLAISCLSSIECTAVGYSYQRPLAESWNGRRWGFESAPSPPSGTFIDLDGVSCVRSTWCMAVGYAGFGLGGSAPRQYAAIWNGSHWAPVPVPLLMGYSTLASVSCVSVTDCIAVGGTGNFSTSLAPLVEQWNGSAWSQQSAPAPNGQRYSQLLGVSCSTALCTAVGEYMVMRLGRVVTFALHWAESTWSLESTVNPSPTNDVLWSISCPSTTSCIAVGGYVAHESISHSLAERRTATSASGTPAAVPRGGPCGGSADRCIGRPTGP